MCSVGPKYGYHPLPSKTILIVKEEHKPKALELFGNTQVQITTTGERHMGAVVGSEEFKKQYVEEKISNWVQDVKILAEIAKDEPQAAYSCFTKAISHRWTYVQRTIPDIATLFEPLEVAIKYVLIPALVGRTISDLDRKIFALPVKLGGMGIYNPVMNADAAFEASSLITRNLTNIICSQEKDLENYDLEGVKRAVEEVKMMKNESQ